MAQEQFRQICDFNICEEEKENDLGEYKAVFYSESLLEINDPRENEWKYCDAIRTEAERIMESRSEEFNAPEEYDYALVLTIQYLIKDKTTNHESGKMEHKIERKSQDKNGFLENLKVICESLENTFKSHLIIMYNYYVYSINLTCNFYVK